LGRITEDTIRLICEIDEAIHLQKKLCFVEQFHVSNLLQQSD
jgi:hypothetical protein